MTELRSKKNGVLYKIGDRCIGIEVGYEYIGKIATISELIEARNSDDHCAYFIIDGERERHSWYLWRFKRIVSNITTTLVRI